MPSRDGSVGTSISASEVNVVTNCRAGYNLSISGPTDRNLYRNGDSTNNTQGQYFTPVDGTSTLKNTTNAWGYSLSANTDSGVFSPLSNTPTLLKTTAQTASQTDIDDDITIYYGVSVSNSLNPGTYEMANNGSIVYQLTMDPSCIDYEVIFNPNGGTGTMANQTIIVNDTTKLTGNSFTAPAMGTSYQNANGTTIPATANKLWTFWGWNTAADGTGDWYKDRESVANLANQGETITLYAQWKQPTLADLTTTTPIGTEKTIDHNTMQDMSAAACWNSDKFTAIGTPYGQATLTDNRDGTVRSYTVAKLPDGYCWMTQNLNLGASTAITLTSDDTDLEEGTTFTLPASNPNDFSISGYTSVVYKPTVYNDVTIPDYTVNGTTYSGKVTAYYSFAAATADANSINKTNTSALSTSICPKNWDLPTSSQYSTLKSAGSINTYNSTNASYTGKNAGNEPYYFVYGGYRKAAGATVNTTYFNNPTTYGYLWTANNITSYNATIALVYSGGGLSYSSNQNKYYGAGVRCITDMDNASYKITFVSTGDGSTQTKKTIIGNSSSSLSNTAFARDGYRIIGWDTDSAGNNVVYSCGEVFTPSSDMTLYTVWEPVYTIQYDGNGADEGVMTNVKHTNVVGGDVFDLFASNYSRAGYGFAGLSFDPNAQPGGASRIYGPNEAIEAPISSIPGEIKTLYAVWVASAGNL
ncbi:InlB B-repeat-containing protein, partial [Candidatus Saccharibacteria bacterium]|nr:InlB B-repeat-containing protein [Candidatus Saccharibacteria bacterium]